MSVARPALCAVAALIALLGTPSRAEEQRLPVADLGTVAHSLNHEIVAEGLRQEAEAGHAAVVLEINTPGGLPQLANGVF